MTVSPYEVAMVPFPEYDCSCVGCVMHHSTDEHSCHYSPGDDIMCDGDSRPMIVHRLTGIVIPREALIQEYTSHKNEHITL